MPNWNSCTIPVTIPIAKLIRNRVPKKRVSRFHVSSLGPVGGDLHHRDEERQPDGQRTNTTSVIVDAELPPDRQLFVQVIPGSPHPPSARRLASGRAPAC